MILEDVSQWDLRRLEATVQTAALCGYVDGHLAVEEREKLCECVAMFAGGEEDARLVVGLIRELPEWTMKRESGYVGRQIEEIKAALRSPSERETAFELAVEVANAHRGIGVGETGFLIRLMDELNVRSDFARRVLASAREKRRASQAP